MKNKWKTGLKIFLGCIAALLVIGVLLIGRMGGFENVMKAIRQTPPTFLYHSDIILTGIGHATIPPIFTGETVGIEGIVYNAAPTPNREKLVILEEDGTLYITDFALSEKTVIAENGNSILTVRNEGFLYRDGENQLYRYLFADGSVLSLGKFEDYMVSKEDFTVSFADTKGKVYVLTADSVEKKEIGAYSGMIDIVAVTNDGSMVVYGSNVKEKETVWFYCDGDLTKLWELNGMNNEYSAVWVYFHEEEAGTSLVIIPSIITETSVYIKPAGGDLKKVELNEYPEAYALYTDEGIYVGTDFAGDKVYWICPDTGEKKKLLDGVDRFRIEENRMYYADWDGNLYRADIHGETLSNQEKIDDGVAYFVCSPQGEFVYYLKESEVKEFCYDLYAAEDGGTPVLVDHLVEYDYEVGFVLFGDAGKTIYYFTNENPLNVSGCYTLKSYTMGEKESVRIDFYVEPESFTGGREDGSVENGAFIYRRFFPQANNLENNQYEWRYFDGTKQETFLKGAENFNVTEGFEENSFVPTWR